MTASVQIRMVSYLKFDILKIFVIISGSEH